MFEIENIVFSGRSKGRTKIIQGCKLKIVNNIFGGPFIDNIFLCLRSLFTSLLFYMFKVSAFFLQKIQDSIPCTYLHVHVSTSYFKMLKHVSLHTKQFPPVGCGQISLLLMLKTHSTVQRGGNLLFNDTHLFMLFTQPFAAFTDVCSLDFGFTILHVHCINLYKLTVVFPFISIFRLALLNHYTK